MAGKTTSAAFWVLVAVLFAFAFQGSRHVWDPDEGRYTAVALNMIRSGDWIVPRLHDERPHFTKPPLTYWALGASMKALGKNEWAARTPIALAFLGTLLLLFLLGRSFLPGSPWLPPLVYATSLLPFAAADLVTTDTLLTFFETLAVLAFLKGEEGKKERPYRLLFWASLGLAFLTKGPPGMIPLLPVSVYLLAEKGLRGWFGLFHPLGLLLFALLGLGWFALVISRTPGLLNYLLEKEFLGRIFSNIHHRNSQWYKAFVIYLPTLLLGALPWAWFYREPLKRTGAIFKVSFWKEKARKDPLGFFCLLWFLLPLPIFFLARSRLPLYLLPLFVPLSLLIAGQVRPRLDLSPSWRKWVILWVLLLLAGKGAWALIPYPKDPVPLAASLQKIHPGPIKEVVFLETKPSYGLTFYLGAEVERVDFQAPPLPFPKDLPPQNLLQEISEKEPFSLFLTRKWDARRFVESLKEKGYHPRLLGVSGKYHVYELAP